MNASATSDLYGNLFFSAIFSSTSSFYVLDDFRVLEISRSGKLTKNKARRQDKGHRAEIRAFIDALESGAESDVLTFSDCVQSTLVSFAVVDALASGESIAVTKAQLK